MKELEPGTIQLKEFTDKMYHYTARVLRVIDCETIEVEVSLGMKTKREEVIRLWGIKVSKAKSKSKKEQEKEEQAKGAVYRLLDGKTIYIQTQRDTTAIYRAMVWIRQKGVLVCVNEQLVRDGFVEPGNEYMKGVKIER